MAANCFQHEKINVIMKVLNRSDCTYPLRRGRALTHRIMPQVGFPNKYFFTNFLIIQL